MSSRRSRPIYDALHLGRSKCASTYLQRTALTAHPEIDLFFEEHKDLFHEYWNYDFGTEPGDFLDRLYACPHWDRKPSSRVRIFSHESLTGHMATGRDARLIADLTVRAFGPIKAFMIVREPYAYVYSVWNQYVQEGGVLSFEDYLTNPSSPTWNRTAQTSMVWRTAMNTDLILYWRGLLGVENLLVLLLEDLLRDSAGFWKPLFDFLGVDSAFVPPATSERVGYSLPLLKVKRRLNRFMQTQHNPSGLLSSRVHLAVRGLGRKYAPFVRSRGRLDARIHAPSAVPGAVRDDNRRLSELLQRDLGELGYEL